MKTILDCLFKSSLCTACLPVHTSPHSSGRATLPTHTRCVCPALTCSRFPTLTKFTSICHPHIHAHAPHQVHPHAHTYQARLYMLTHRYTHILTYTPILLHTDTHILACTHPLTHTHTLPCSVAAGCIPSKRLTSSPPSALPPSWGSRVLLSILVPNLLSHNFFPFNSASI